jgi:hypothetical protein
MDLTGLLAVGAACGRLTTMIFTLFLSFMIPCPFDQFQRKCIIKKSLKPVSGL